MNDIKVLDCTLRDGGYLNNWKWGKSEAMRIVRQLTLAYTDFVEIGYLKSDRQYAFGESIGNTVSSLNRFLPTDSLRTKYAAMILNGSYDLKYLEDYSGRGIEIIRIAAHEDDIFEGIQLAIEIKKRGYLVCLNPININGYSDDLIRKIVDCVNDAKLYQLSIVDTFGSMTKNDFLDIYKTIDNNLDNNVRIGLHFHNNLNLAFSHVQDAILYNGKHAQTIDGSLLGIGRTPGNLQIELLAEYINREYNEVYDLNKYLDAIDDYIFKVQEKGRCMYHPAYFLSARHKIHRNYAEYFISRKLDLSRINEIFLNFDNSKKSVFDVNYAQLLCYKIREKS